jgi:hypothetical protein
MDYNMEYDKQLISTTMILQGEVIRQPESEVETESGYYDQSKLVTSSKELLSSGFQVHHQHQPRRG